MSNYNCHMCGGVCDAGELENGVCFDCRREAAEQAERSTLKVIRDWNKLHPWEDRQLSVRSR